VRLLVEEVGSHLEFWIGHFEAPARVVTGVVTLPVRPFLLMDAHAVSKTDVNIHNAPANGESTPFISRPHRVR